MTVPSASATSAIVDAVPMVLQCPRPRIMADSERMNCSAEKVPALTSSDNRQTAVPQPRETPRKVPVHRAVRHHHSGQIDRGAGHE